MIKNKKLMTILILLVVVIASVSVVYMFSLHNKDKKIVSAYYDFEDGALTTSSSGYTGNSDFRISDLTEFKNFETSVSNGCSFSSKKVLLISDIDCGGQDLTFNNLFSGELDGNGSKLSNFNINSYKRIDQNYGMKLHRYGLFNNFNGTIIDLHLDNFTCDIDATTIGDESADWYIGGLVGLCSDNGTIEGCMITNFRVVKVANINPGGPMAYDIHDIYISGIVAMGNPKIYDCYVGQITSEYSSINKKLYVYKNGLVYGASVNYIIGADELHYYYNTGIRVEGCVVNGSYDNTYTADPNQNSYLSNCYSSKTTDNFKNLGSNLAAGGGSTGWYYYSGYNDGWPYLRSFIEWQQVGFNNYYNAPYTINVDYLYIPEGLDAGSINGSTLTELDFFGQTVEVTMKSNCYNFDFWSWDAFINNTYAGYYYVSTKTKEVKIKFSSADNTTTDLTNLTLGTEYTIGCGTSISISVEKYSKEGCKWIMLSFTDQGGTKRSVKYIANNGYYIKQSTLADVTKTSFTVHGHGTMPDLNNISVETALKSYDTTFQ